MNLCYCSVGRLMGSSIHVCLANSRACLATLGSLKDISQCCCSGAMTTTNDLAQKDCIWDTLCQ